jgi:hypothetical protein
LTRPASKGALQRLRNHQPRKFVQDGEPDLFVRGNETYKANLNFENPLGTIASIEHTLRGRDRRAEDEQHEIERHEKALADYRDQLGRPFEHESRLKDLLAKQAQLNACLDVDKHEAQIVDEPQEVTELSAAAMQAGPVSPTPQRRKLLPRHAPAS